MYRRRLVGVLAMAMGSVSVTFAGNAFLASAAGISMQAGPSIRTVPVKELVEQLSSTAGAVRTAATRELFRRGTSSLAELRAAGAKPMATIRPPRVDAVYSLIAGHVPGHYRRDSFGILLEPGVGENELTVMAARHGFTVTSPPRDNAVPSVYVRLQDEKLLETVLKSLLVEESQVVTVNLNYVERR